MAEQDQGAKKKLAQHVGPTDDADVDLSAFEIDFSTFVISLATTVMVNLGVSEHPAVSGHHVDVVMAKNNIDILAILQEKTRGNPTPEESRRLGSALYDLRMNYVTFRGHA